MDETRIARDETGRSYAVEDMTYSEWKEKFVDGVDIGGKSGIIESEQDVSDAWEKYERELPELESDYKRDYDRYVQLGNEATKLLDSYESLPAQEQQAILIKVNEISQEYSSLEATLNSLAEKIKEHRFFSSLKNSGIDYNAVKPLGQSLTTDEIINRLSGGDLTDGSCSSLALAYAGNRSGLDVLDFRGGWSCNFFSRPSSIARIAKLPGVNGTVTQEYNDFTTVNKLLNTMADGKEYYLATGRHAAIVRKTISGYEYLELQDPISSGNGFKALTTAKLRSRFACQKSHTSLHKKCKATSVLIDIDSLGKNQEFSRILGYLNTTVGEQKKGAAGHVK